MTDDDALCRHRDVQTAHSPDNVETEKLVAFVPGALFFAEKPDVATLRLSFATANVEKIREGIARLGAAL